MGPQLPLAPYRLVCIGEAHLQALVVCAPSLSLGLQGIDEAVQAHVHLGHGADHALLLLRRGCVGHVRLHRGDMPPQVVDVRLAGLNLGLEEVHEVPHGLARAVAAGCGARGAPSVGRALLLLQCGYSRPRGLVRDGTAKLRHRIFGILPSALDSHLQLLEPHLHLDAQLCGARRGRCAAKGLRHRRRRGRSAVADLLRNIEPRVGNLGGQSLALLEQRSLGLAHHGLHGDLAVGALAGDVCAQGLRLDGAGGALLVEEAAELVDLGRH
mmetsp:Transcript_8281/g.23765  ORF Transcript_8281/g.23765 Transcript_8281/m.23765 type:complete len:269 (+) Transcript_8281:222-1028(+)